MKGNRTNHRRGMAHPQARLTDEQVEEIRKRREAERLSYFALSLDYPCSESTARRICRGETRAMED